MRKLAGLFSLLSLLIIMGCAKEYSYEGGDLVEVHDSLPPPVVVNDFPACPFCQTITGTPLSSWSFKKGNTTVCGSIDTAIITLERTAFTFFGPSACSVDSGLVITVYLGNESLNRDRTNVTINNIAFYYYDRVTPSYIFMSLPNSPFTGTIDNYDHQAKIASGTFTGNALRSDGSAASITSGKFKVKLL